MYQKKTESKKLDGFHKKTFELRHEGSTLGKAIPYSDETEECLANRKASSNFDVLPNF